MRLTKVICFILLFMSGGYSSATAEEFPHFTAERAIAAGRRNAKPGNSVTILWKSIANADMRRIGDQALEQAQAHKIELFENGMLVKILRSGGYLLAETDPRTNGMVATHLVLSDAVGTVNETRTECRGFLKLADAEEVVKKTVELVKRLESTPSTSEGSLAGRFYGGKFPDADQSPDSLFITPASYRKLGVKPDKVREATALLWGYAYWPSRYALAMPTFSASPAAAGDAAEKERDLLKAKFLQSKDMDPNIDPVDFDDVRGEQQLQQRIDLLRTLDSFLEESLKKESDPIVVGANLSTLLMPLRVDVDSSQAGQYVLSAPPKALFLWRRVETGGFAVKEITWDW